MKVKSNPLPTLTESDINRFWSKVAITANPIKCWLWESGKRRRGYGRFNVTIGANKDIGLVSTRVAYYLHYGVDPVGSLVAHRCDNPSCVNPNHLFLGTSKDNTRDMLAKGRHTSPVGSAHGQSKLTEADVLVIRKMRSEGVSAKEISGKFNINTSAVYLIVNRKRWIHI